MYSFSFKRIWILQILISRYAYIRVLQSVFLLDLFGITTTRHDQNKKNEDNFLN